MEKYSEQPVTQMPINISINEINIGTENQAPLPQQEEWTPTAQPPSKLILNEKALDGYAGEFVYQATKDSEASPVAVLLTFLCRFGCGAYNPETLAPFLQIGESKHYSRLFVAICGQTAKARKGTSARPIHRLFTSNGYPIDKIQVSPGPLSSGEGLIYAVRDEIPNFSNNDENKPKPKPPDKRLFVLDEELAAALKVSKREGNTLSSVIRGFWDSGCASPMTKQNRISATDVHVCIVAHITKDELAMCLQNVELLNGFANRFLWALVHRSKQVPIPLPIEDSILKRLQERLRTCIASSRQIGKVAFSREAQDVWCNYYSYLSRDKVGLVGAVTGRAEAQTARLALIYALLDKSNSIEIRHLESAFAVWKYCEDSAEKIFVGRGSNNLDDKILNFLQNGSLTTSEISNLLQRNVKSFEIHNSLERLISAGLVNFQKQGSVGRKSNIFTLASK